MSRTPLSRRAFLSGTALSIPVLCANPLRALSSISPVTLNTPLGPLQGEESAGVRVFRGVPFAQPPVGPLRFRPPAALRPWTAPRDATRFAPAALQPEEPSLAKSEDCLYLNVWAPAAKGTYPVYVWIHGGGFTGGYSFAPIFDGTQLAQSGIICVTVAYRLGVFGFLDLAPLLGTSYAGSANNGVRDLMAALSWVQQNIVAFGGDPNRVTVGGQSAGAKLTDVLMGVPAARPLFHQMVSESGGAERVATAEQAVEVAAGFGKLWRSSSGSPVSSLTSAPAASLIPVQFAFAQQSPRHFPLRPAVDGVLLPRLPVETIANGNSAGKRLLIGTNQDESAGFVGPHPDHDATSADLGNTQPAQFLPIYQKYEKLYPELTVEQRRIRALTAEEYWVPSVRVAEAHVKGGGQAWMYRFDFREGSGRLGAFASHSLELRFVWDHPLSTVANAAAESTLAREMFDAWNVFLRGRAPEGFGLPTWPKYTAEERRTMIFDATSRVEAQPHQAELQLWKSLL